jgi:hypothetical protein
VTGLRAEVDQAVRREDGPPAAGQADRLREIKSGLGELAVRLDAAAGHTGP